jgi:hypothetical protein
MPYSAEQHVFVYFSAIFRINFPLNLSKIGVLYSTLLSGNIRNTSQKKMVKSLGKIIGDLFRSTLYSCLKTL